MKNFRKIDFNSKTNFVFWGFLVSGLLCNVALFSQKNDAHLPTANKEFVAGKFAEAEANYRIAMHKFSNNKNAAYNLGNAIYKQNQIAEARAKYLKAIENLKTKPQKHQAYHNLGNVYMKEKKYSEAVEAYKNALRNVPTDEESRYNLALAKKMLKENPPKNNDKDKNKDKKDNKKDDKKDQNKNEDKKNQDNPNKEGENPPKNDNQPQPTQNDMSKQRLENLLDAVNNEENKIQKKVNAKKQKGKPVDTDKDW